MPKTVIPAARQRTTNNTVKLPLTMQRRVEAAIQVAGFTVWAEFCRVALTEKCHHIEDHLRSRDPLEFQRVYGPAAESAAPRKKKLAS